MDPLAILLERVREEIANISNGVASGACKDYSAYAKLVGTLDGLRWTEQQIIDLNRRIDEL